MSAAIQHEARNFQRCRQVRSFAGLQAVRSRLPEEYGQRCVNIRRRVDQGDPVEFPEGEIYRFELAARGLGDPGRRGHAAGPTCRHGLTNAGRPGTGKHGTERQSLCRTDSAWQGLAGPRMDVVFDQYKGLGGPGARPVRISSGSCRPSCRRRSTASCRGAFRRPARSDERRSCGACP